MQLFVDDGVPDRGHRTNLMEPSWAVTGISVGDHKQYTKMLCLTYARGYVENTK